MNRPFSRRQMLARFGFGAAALSLPWLSRPVRAAQESRSRKRILRIAHITDVHVQPELSADKGLIKCLHAIQNQPDKPDLILNTGDCVFDSFSQTRSRTEQLWNLWTSIFRNECSLPVYHALGNHDIWGWNKRRSETTGEEAQWGKKWAQDVFGLSKPYHSFDKNGWHFIALDSVYPHERGYTARLDDEQFDWLASDLSATKPETPVLVMSHIPILSIAAAMGGGRSLPEGTLLPHSVVHTDNQRILGLFRKRNVKLAISGHLHLLDDVEYAGTHFICNGAVCGGWWKGSHRNECDCGYAMLNLYDDGSFDREYVNYGWAAQVPATQPA